MTVLFLEVCVETVNRFWVDQDFDPGFIIILQK